MHKVLTCNKDRDKKLSINLRTASLANASSAALVKQGKTW